MEQTVQALISADNHQALPAVLFGATAIGTRPGILAGSLPGA